MDSNTITSFQVDCYLWHIRKLLSMRDMCDAPFDDRLRRDQKALKGRGSTLGLDLRVATMEGKKVVEEILKNETDENLRIAIAPSPAPRYITDMSIEEISREWYMLMPRQKMTGSLMVKMDQAIMNKRIMLKANFSVLFNQMETLVSLRAFTDDGAIVAEIYPIPSMPGHSREDVKNAIGILIGGLEWNDNSIRASENIQRFAWGVRDENRGPPFSPKQKRHMEGRVESEI
ncbi:nonstructural protein 1 [Influenza A virus (A/Guinea fowl/New York/19501-4/2006(H7N2))]|uniref:Non-structural protein 1 n=5 Tax=H7N2 subtype TaxID=119214 RepID=A9X0N2_9INFA|nr:nonstructural protein 1 [Influenza A virus (A/environment/New York/19501-1/2006(H7N2))]ABY51442.1 nonstructural protein 1 [Influenza A virus (A/Guinea fowl/New York/19501-4/2006(H7N2))]ACJ09999.1 nonstructural protein 1 [Influenza A virus (A/environment/New York/19501-3/2006(H7N2))]ACJ10010.1 nonstructural protein 1 [Influenza A virus (A/unknown/New York/19501-5/2006(H7N2))]ACO95618.1 nonstructural protein 1 [Influenza A virus (A/environment/New York/19501-2/2006(H7N2))]